MITLQVDVEDLAALDALAGPGNRSAWVRDAISRKLAGSSSPSTGSELVREAGERKVHGPNGCEHQFPIARYVAGVWVCEVCG